MEAKELRIGNLLQIKEGGIKSYPVEWFHLDPENDCLGHSQPIPLTKEWLENLGFEKGVNNYHNQIELYSNGRGGFNYNAAYFEQDLLISIEYVHQLQNLYFALTEEELTTKQ